MAYPTRPLPFLLHGGRQHIPAGAGWAYRQAGNLSPTWQAGMGTGVGICSWVGRWHVQHRPVWGRSPPWAVVVAAGSMGRVA